MAYKMLAITREPYAVPVEMKIAGEVIDPSSFAVEFAITTREPEAEKTLVAPTDDDWVAGAWQHNTETDEWEAYAVIGDAEAQLQIVAGKLYDVFIRVTDEPNRPARVAGRILAT